MDDTPRSSLKRQSNPTVRRYVVSVERAGKLTYLANGKEIEGRANATHWSAPRHAYLAMEIYGKKVKERSAEERRGIFMEVVDTKEMA